MLEATSYAVPASLCLLGSCGVTHRGRHQSMQCWSTVGQLLLQNQVYTSMISGSCTDWRTRKKIYKNKNFVLGNSCIHFFSLVSLFCIWKAKIWKKSTVLVHHIHYVGIIQWEDNSLWHLLSTELEQKIKSLKLIPCTFGNVKNCIMLSLTWRNNLWQPPNWAQGMCKWWSAAPCEAAVSKWVWSLQWVAEVTSSVCQGGQGEQRALCILEHGVPLSKSTTKRARFTGRKQVKENWKQ